MPESPLGRSTRWLTTLTIDPQAAGVDREAVRQALTAADIEARPVWKPMHLQPALMHCPAVRAGVSDRLFAQGLCLPSGSSLTEEDLERIVGRAVRQAVDVLEGAGPRRPTPDGVHGRRRNTSSLRSWWRCSSAAPILASAVVPPWQGPDEPGHFTTTYDLTVSPSVRQNIQADVLQSMVRNRFWALNEDLPPDPLPRVFYLVSDRNLGLGNLSQPLYYSLGAMALMLSRPADLEAAYYHLRCLGVLLAIAALCVRLGRHAELVRARGRGGQRWRSVRSIRSFSWPRST